MEARERMKVSVVVPVYNKAPYLREAFDTIFGQTFRDMEVIAVDDRSTDDSLSILRSFTDPRLRIIALEYNRGPAGAVQCGIDAALGEYIVRMDADDLMDPRRVERQVAYMDARPDVGASGGVVVLFGKDDDQWRFPLTDEACKAQLLFGVPIPQGGSILRTSVLRTHDVRYRDEWPRIGEDWLFWVSLAPYTRFGNIEQEVIRYRRGEQNISHGHDLVAARRPRVPLVLRALGLDPTPEQVETHLAASLVFPGRPDVAMVRRVHAWLAQLEEWNRRSGLTTLAAMQERTERAWNALFFRLPDHGFGPAFAHLWIEWSWPRFIYAAKVWSRKLRSGEWPGA
jgi:glycosyltransferase involved in cell wall biosynthesis